MRIFTVPFAGVRYLVVLDRDGNVRLHVILSF
jgi:hypothetical protein